MTSILTVPSIITDSSTISVIFWESDKISLTVNLILEEYALSSIYCTETSTTEFIGRVTSKIWQNLNWVRFHKNTDSVDRHIKKFEDKFEYLKIAEIMINTQYYNGNERFFLFVDVDREKILGDFDKQLLQKAIDDYIEKYYRKIISPMLQQRDLKGKKKFTQATAVQFVRDRIVKNYCT